MESETPGHAEENPEISIEEYLNNSDTNRSASLSSIWPYPLALQHAPHLQHELLPLREDIRDILNLHKFSEDVGFIPFVATKPQYPGGDSPINLLRVILQDDHHMFTQLDTAKDNILELLNRRGIMNMDVEIVNIHLCFKPSIFLFPHITT